MKVIARVRFNSGFAYVLDTKIEFKYSQHNTCIIGKDGAFRNFYAYDKPSPGFYAFGGRKFTINLENGGEVEAWGQWWSGLNSESLGLLESPVINVTVGYLDDLKQCYVFSGMWAVSFEFAQLIKEYRGITYEYWDYDKILRIGKLPAASLRKYRNQRTNNRKRKLFTL